MKAALRLVVASAALAAVLTGCDNMKHQRNLRPLVPASQFTDGVSARPLPAHVVASDDPPINDPLNIGLDAAGQPLVQIPIPLSAATLARGRERYNIYCAVCHGEDGYGTGIVIRRGFPPPPSYHDERLRDAPAGHFFDVMTRGYGVMLPYSDRIEPRDRWAIVGYIRALQRSQHARLADVPVDVREELTSR